MYSLASKSVQIICRLVTGNYIQHTVTAAACFSRVLQECVPDLPRLVRVWVALENCNRVSSSVEAAWHSLRL